MSFKVGDKVFAKDGSFNHAALQIEKVEAGEYGQLIYFKAARGLSSGFYAQWFEMKSDHEARVADGGGKA